MKWSFMKILVKWFEMKWAWIFIDLKKQAAWGEYLRKKYGNDR